MRLLHTRDIHLEEFLGENIPPYAILSHTWGEEEISLQDMRLGEASKRKAYKKLLGCCCQAQSDGYFWVWIDTCCIDKSSSAELQEAINSMFTWYQLSSVCYAYLEDVPNLQHGWGTSFRKSRWWERGWTLRTLETTFNIDR